jgi:hypothetical protein
MRFVENLTVKCDKRRWHLLRPVATISGELTDNAVAEGCQQLHASGASIYHHLHHEPINVPTAGHRPSLWIIYKTNEP